MSVRAATRPSVVVLGGGFGGATTAKYLRMWSAGSVGVTLVEPRARHTSCVLSNLVLNQRIRLRELEIGYDSLSSVYGVNIVRDRAVEISGSGKRVRLREGGWLNYDYLIVATGIGFTKPEGIDFQRTPHAWIAGQQTRTLASQVGRLGPNSTCIISVPEAPYRCPPGPYERACLVADLMLRRGFDKGDARVQVLDANTSIQAKRHTFETAFNGIYRNVIEYIPNAPVTAVDSDAGMVESGMGVFTGDVVNVIPAQHASGLVRRSGLTGNGRWANVDPLTYASTESGFDGVHVIGDSQGSKQPKSAHMANAQAKICADAILRELAGLSNADPERIANVTTNSACYSPITYDQASWLTANYAYNAGTGQMELTSSAAAGTWSADSYGEMFAWASNLFTDSFH